MELTKNRAAEFAIKIMQDTSIDDDAFNTKYQHIGDDLFYYAAKVMLT